MIEMESLIVSTRLRIKPTSNGTRMLDVSTFLQWLNGANEDKRNLGTSLLTGHRTRDKTAIQDHRHIVHGSRAACSDF